MINIIDYSEIGLKFTNIEEISESHPRLFIVTQQRNDNQLSEMKNPTLSKNKQILNNQQEIKVFLIQNSELNHYSFLTIFKLENSQIDLMNFLTNLIMSRTDGFNFTFTQTGIESLQKLNRQICIEKNVYTLSHLINHYFKIISLDNNSQKDCQQLLLFEHEINSAQSLDFNNCIQSSFQTVQKLIQIICQSFRSLEPLNQEEMHSQFQQELFHLLQKLNNL